MVLFRCVTGGTGGFEIAITTEDTDLYGQTITISKNGSTVGTTVFDNTGNASYTVTETGTYSVSVTYDGRTVTETVEVTAFAVDLAMGFVLEKWLEFGDISGTYASLSDVLADEDAVRQLMTIHAAVDYLASFESTDASVVTILNDNYAAKWISLTDYAMDTLEAAYGTLMGTIGKYGYGEWGITDATTTPPTWGALGNVPVMTSNTAPYGTASAYQVFDGNPSTTASGTDFSYTFTNPVCVKDFVVKDASGNAITGGTLQSCNDGSTWGTPTDGEYYLGWRVHFAASQTVATVQFYGRTLRVSVPKMSGNTTPYGEAFADSSYSTNAPWKAFDDSASTMWEADDVNPAYGNTHIGYEFESNVVLVMATFKDSASSGGRGIKTLKYQGYDGENWVDITDVLTRSVTTTDDNPYTTIIPEANRAPYKKYRMRIMSGGSEYPSSNAMIYSMQFYGKDYSEREWDISHPRRYLYDHGVEVETLDSNVTSAGGDLQAVINNASWSTDLPATKAADYLDISVQNASPFRGVPFATTNKIDLTNYSLLFVNSRCFGSTGTYWMEVDVSSYRNGYWYEGGSTQRSTASLMIIPPLSPINALDVSNINQEQYVVVWTQSNGAHYGDVNEIWLE